MRRHAPRGAAAGRGTPRSAARRPPASAPRGSRSGPGASPKAPASVRTASMRARAGVGDARSAAVEVSRPSWSSWTTSPGSSARRDGGSRNDGGLAADPFLEQRAAAAPVGVARRSWRSAKLSEVTRSASPVARARLDGHRVVVLVGAQPPATSAPAAARSPARGPARSPRRRRARRPRDRRAPSVATGRRSRGWKRITPSLSTASKPNCRASGAIEARGLSSAVIR